MHPDTQSLGYQDMTLVALLGAEMRLDFHDLSPSFFRFGEQEQHEHSPPSIQDVLGQMGIFDHVGNHQRFDANGLVAPYVVIRGLVQEVFSLVGYLGVGLGYQTTCFLPTM